MRTTRLVFNKVSMTFTKTGTCHVCGGKASRSRVFYQTLNPYNTNEDGSVKTVQQIKDELRIQGNEWKATYVVRHARCE